MPRSKRVPKKSRSKQVGSKVIKHKTNVPAQINPVPKPLKKIVKPTIDLRVAQKSRMSLSEMLDEIADALEDKEDHNFTFESNSAPVGEVCWKWALYGANNVQTDDIAWAYNYVLPPQIGVLPVPQGTPQAALNKLNEAKPLFFKHDGKQERTTVRSRTSAHQIAIQGLALAAGLALSDTGPLTLKVYWDDRPEEFMYRHLEIEYDNRICVKKFNGGQVQATTGVSLLDRGDPKIKVRDTSVFIDINSLSKEHRKYIREIYGDLED